MKIPIEVSNRHVHLSKEDLEKLFGLGYELKKLRELSQPGQFAAEERVKLISNKEINNVRILGPVREKTQVEISKSDARFLGLDVPVRDSGDLGNSAGIKLAGPNGEVDLKEGAIISRRHLHISEEESKELGVSNGDVVSVEIENDRGIRFNNVLVRAGKGHKLALHLDSDEGNAAGIDGFGEGKLRLCP